MAQQNGFQVQVNGSQMVPSSMNGGYVMPMNNGGMAMNGGYGMHPQQQQQFHQQHQQPGGVITGNAGLSSWDKYQYTKIYNALKDLEEYNVKISVPEFVFIGFQSSGKTSAVSQAAKLAVGVMKHGTASRCPTRFKLISNPKQKKPLIKVNGVLCKDEADLTDKTLELTKKYEEQDIFSKDIIEVRIESCQVPELTFVDLPGLIKGDNKQFRTAKRQLDELTGHFLHEQNPDGSYRYIPILVREPVDVEHDTHYEVTYIDGLVQKYGRGNKRRIAWRSDTLFIVNKFDKQINRSPASSLIEYMKYCCEYGQTVLTIMNAKNENTANMSQAELNKFVLTAEHNEEEKWEQVMAEFTRMDDENLHELTLLKKEIVGVAKMNELLAEKMCEIVKKILPSIERQLEASEAEKRQEISGMIKQIDMCDPRKLKSQCVAFNNRFLQFLKEFYNGSLTPRISKKYHKSWSKEVNDYHVATTSSGLVNGWKYEIQPSKLENLLKSLTKKPLSKWGRKEQEIQEREQAARRQKVFKLGQKPAELLSLLEMELIASASINRMIDAWVCQVAYMPFPMYTDQDIVNICGTFYATKQPELWTSIRNVVLDAVGYLADASKFLAEMFRYKLKENADIIFEYTLVTEFGSLEVKHNSILKLLERTLRDYKKEIDNIVDDFIGVASVGPKNQAQILDKAFCEETINIGNLMDDLLDSKHKSKYHGANPNQTSPSLRQSNTDQTGKSNEAAQRERNGNQSPLSRGKSKRYATRLPSVSVPDDQAPYTPKSNTPRTTNINITNVEINIHDSDSTDSEDMKELELSPRDKKRNMRKKKSRSRDEESEEEKEEAKESAEQRRRRKAEKKKRKEEKRKKAAIEKLEAERRFNAENYDGEFYKQIYGLELNHKITFGSTSYEIPLIRHLSHCFWTNIKYFTIRDVIQKLSNRVMAHVNQHDDRLANAIQCGVDRRQVQLLINKLVDRTGVDVAALEKLIMSKSTIPIPKAINDLDDKEIQEIYGIDRARLVQQKQKKVNELNEYRKLKMKTLLKIHAIKNNQYDQIEGDVKSNNDEERANGHHHGNGVMDKPKVGVYIDENTVAVEYRDSDSEELYTTKKSKKKTSSKKQRRKKKTASYDLEVDAPTQGGDYSDDDYSDSSLTKSYAD